MTLYLYPGDSVDPEDTFEDTSDAIAAFVHAMNTHTLRPVSLDYEPRRTATPKPVVRVKPWLGYKDNPDIPRFGADECRVCDD
jgi:hypothetical protein